MSFAFHVKTLSSISVLAEWGVDTAEAIWENIVHRMSDPNHDTKQYLGHWEGAWQKTLEFKKKV